MFKINQIIEAQITHVGKTHLMVHIKNRWVGIVHISEISDYFVPNINLLFKNNDWIILKILEINRSQRFLKLSFKSIHPLFLRQPFQYKIEETPGKSKALWLKTQKEI